MKLAQKRQTFEAAEYIERCLDLALLLCSLLRLRFQRQFVVVVIMTFPVVINSI